VFESVGNGFVRYVGQMICDGYVERSGYDSDGKLRRVIVFKLTKV
jgi:hypothetical protein